MAQTRFCQYCGRSLIGLKKSFLLHLKKCERKLVKGYRKAHPPKQSEDDDLVN